MGQVTGLITAAVQLGLNALENKPRREIGPFVAQVTVEEISTDELEITDHPIEMGAQISDHAWKRPAELVITAGWSDSPTRAGFLDGLIGAVTGTIDGVTSILTGEDVSQIREIYQGLLELQVSAQPMTVYTGKRVYTDMLIKTLRQETNRETENSLVVTATLRQVIIVTTRTLIVGAPPEAQADAPTTEPPSDEGEKSLKGGDNYNEEAGAQAITPTTISA